MQLWVVYRNIYRKAPISFQKSVGASQVESVLLPNWNTDEGAYNAFHGKIYY